MGTQLTEYDPAINIDGLTGNLPGQIRGQKNGQISHILRGLRAFKRSPGLNHSPEGLLRRYSLGLQFSPALLPGSKAYPFSPHRGPDQSRTNGVGIDVKGGHLQGDGLGQVNHSGL